MQSKTSLRSKLNRVVCPMHDQTNSRRAQARTNMRTSIVLHVLRLGLMCMLTRKLALSVLQTCLPAAGNLLTCMLCCGHASYCSMWALQSMIHMLATCPSRKFCCQNGTVKFEPWLRMTILLTACCSKTTLGLSDYPSSVKQSNSLPVKVR